MSEIPVRYETDGATGVITIDRPQARNSINREVAVGIEAAIDQAEADDAVQVLILTGTPPVFCAGADLKVVGAGGVEQLYTERGGFGGLVRRARTKPLIAAVDGAALAGGTEMVLSCDLVVASSAAKFGLPEVKRGLVAGAGGVFRLGRKLPVNVAMQYVLTGDPLPAEVAHTHGLVNILCEPGAALDVSREIALSIAANAPLAVRESRALVAEATFDSEESAWASSELALQRVLASDDLAEGVAAFAEKRDPVWTGR